MPKVASRTRVLKVKPATQPTTDPAAQAKAQDAAEVQAAEDKIAAQNALDKFRELDILNGKEHVISQSLTQCFGQKTIAHFGGDVARIPRWRFSRRYLGPQAIILDLFRRQQDYDSADVEARRKLVKQLGGRYAACGPQHTRFPIRHDDPEVQSRLRKDFPSAQEQLEQG